MYDVIIWIHYNTVACFYFFRLFISFPGQVWLSFVAPNLKSRQSWSINSSKQKDKATTEDDDDDVKEIIQDDISICCRSEASNNSISSFTFPMYKFAMFFFRECLLVTQEHMSPNYVSLNQKLILVLYLFLPDCITKKMKVSQCRR